MPPSESRGPQSRNKACYGTLARDQNSADELSRGKIWYNSKGFCTHMGKGRMSGKPQTNANSRSKLSIQRHNRSTHPCYSRSIPTTAADFFSVHVRLNQRRITTNLVSSGSGARLLKHIRIVSDRDPIGNRTLLHCRKLLC